MKKPIIGQEAICPDGLGRVVKFDLNPPNHNITIDTYVSNRGCTWDANNVELIPVKKDEVVEHLQLIVSQLDSIFQFMRSN